MDDKKNEALDLLLRIQRAQAGEDVGERAGYTRCVGFDINGHNLFAPVTAVSQVVKCETVTPVPLTKSWVLGVTNVRGSVYTVFDLAGFAGFRMRSTRGVMPIIVLSARGYSSAMRVSEVRGLKLVPDDAAHAEHPPELDALRPWLGRTISIAVSDDDATAEIWTELDIAKLTASEEFIAVSAKADAA